MGSSIHKARAAGAAVATGGMAVVVMALTGAHPDWMGDWIFRCGARGFSHACRDGEIPWGAVVLALMAVGVGLLMLGGDVRTRRGGISFRAHFTRHPDARATGDAPPRSQGPPPHDAATSREADPRRP